MKAFWQKLSVGIKDREGLFKEVNSLESGEVSATLFEHSNNNYHSAVDDVFKAKFGSDNYEISNQIKDNVTQFSAFKSAHFSELMQGKTKEEKEAILAAYQRQLSTELNLVSRSSRSAKQWQEVVRTKDIYPNIEYLPSSSADPRTEHIDLYGTVLPIDHPFWDEYLPPNGFNCKCRFGKTASDVNEPGDLPTISKGVTGNAGKDGQVFKPNHPYVANVNPLNRAIIQKQYEAFKLQVPYGILDFKNKNGSINVHPYAHKSDVTQNFAAAKILLTQVKGLKIAVRPHVENVITNLGKSGRANPEYLINGKIGELKVISSNSIKNRFKSAKNQGAEVVVFDIQSSLTIDRVIDMIRGEIKMRGENPFKAIYIIKDGKAVQYK